MPRIHIGHHFFGAGNFGDDMMIAGFLHAWKQLGRDSTLTCSIPFDRAAQQRRFPQVAWLPYDEAARASAIQRCSVWLGLGGPAFETISGTWMMEHLEHDLRLCKRFGKPMFFLCVGVSNRDALKDPRSLAVLREAVRIWTRDGASARRIAALIGPEKVTAGADLAHLFLMRQSIECPPTERLGWVLHFDDRTLLRLSAIERAINLLPNWQHAWLVQEIRDLRGSEQETYRGLCRAIQARLTVCRPDYRSDSMDGLLASWPRCGTKFTSRFHAALLAAWRGSRLVVVERDDKLRGLVETLDCVALPSVWDGDEVVRAIGRGRVVDRAILENQADIAWRCCAEFIRCLPALTTRNHLFSAIAR